MTRFRSKGHGAGRKIYPLKSKGFVRCVVVNKHPYLYKVQNERQGDKVIQHVREYIGRATPQLARKYKIDIPKKLMK